MFKYHWCVNSCSPTSNGVLFFVPWQKRIEFVPSGARTPSEYRTRNQSALGPNIARVSIKTASTTGSVVAGRFVVYDTDGETELFASAAVNVTAGDIFQYTQ